MKLTGKIVALGFFFLVLAEVSHGADALRKMTVGQAGVNPGAGLFSIAVNQGFYKKHGLDVEIIKTNTTAAVQAMLANKMQMATGAGIGRLRHRQPRRRAWLHLGRLLGECISLQDHGAERHQEGRRPQRQDRPCRRALRHHPRHRAAICLGPAEDRRRERCQVSATLQRRSRQHPGRHGKRRGAVRYPGAALRFNRRAARL